MQAISALRATASHAPYDVGILDAGGGVHISDGDPNAIVIGRTPSQVTSQPLSNERAQLTIQESLISIPKFYCRSRQA